MGKLYGIYDEMVLEPYSLVCIREFQVERAFQCHDKAKISGIISQEHLTLYEYMLQSNQCISLYFFTGGKKHLLFQGVASRINVHQEGGMLNITLYLDGLTKVLDRKKKWIDYQSYDKKKSQIIQEKMELYQNIGYEDKCIDETIRKFLLQYEETDYTFLKRLLSSQGEVIYTRMERMKGYIHFGTPSKNATERYDLADYKMIFERKMEYEIETLEFMDLGTCLETKYGTLVVKQVKNCLIEGESKNIYRLCRVEDVKVAKKYNPWITGISLDGVIKDRKRDKVKIELNATKAVKPHEQRWFSYSSPAASADGSGWYCMPEVGEDIRLFCPTDAEEDAYVISAIRSDTGGYAAKMDGSGAKSPETKTLSNVQGQEVSFTPEGVSFNCAKSAVSMKLTPEGEITITTQKDLEIVSKELISFRGEQGISMTAEDGIRIKNQQGASFKVREQMYLDGERIRNNC